MPDKPSPKTILANGDDYVRRLSKAASRSQTRALYTSTPSGIDSRDRARLRTATESLMPVS
jgi:hypothetical protein